MAVRKFALAVVWLASAAIMLTAAQAQFRPAPGGPGGPGAPGQAPGAPGPAPGAPGQAPGAPGKAPPPTQPQPDAQQGDRFTFRVCNRSKIPLFAAVLYKVSGDSWRMFGWTPYKPGVCGPVRGTYPRDDFYWYVEDGPSTVTFPGNDAQGCINPKMNFDRTVTGEYQCAPDERIVGFTKIDEKGIREGITLN